MIVSDAVLTAARCLYVIDKKSWAFYDEIAVIRSDFRHVDYRKRTSWLSCEKYLLHKNYNINLDRGLVPFAIAIIEMRIGADLVEVGNEIVKLCPPTKHYFEVFTIGLGFIPRNPEIFPMVGMRATLFEYTSCGRYFSNLSVTINEDTQVC